MSALSRAMALLVFGVLLASLAPAASEAVGPARDGEDDEARVAVQLLAINDFHGALETRTLFGRRVGGAAVLAAYLDQWEEDARAEGVLTLRVAAGDLIGGGPPVSALLQDEPTVAALGLMRLQYSAVGNHEFDRGPAELRRLQYGGCHPATGCFAGAAFHYLAANVIDEETGQPLFPPYAVESVRGVPLGFIGVVLKETPAIATPEAVAGLRFLDEAETVNRYVAELRAQGIEAIVVLLHQGGRGDRRGGPITGEVVPMVAAMDSAVDVVVSGHTHDGYWGFIAGKLVTQAFSGGSAFADIDLVLDRRTGDIVEKRARIIDTFAGVAPGNRPDPHVAAIVQGAQAKVAPRVNRVVGVAAHPITADPNAAGESALGNLIADAQRWRMGTQLAFMNPGGIRADIAAGTVTWGALFTVQPFGNELVRLELTGAQVERLLEQQWADPAHPRILQVAGLTYAWDARGPAGDRVDPADIRVGGAPLEPDAVYTVGVNRFLASGGDYFTVLREGTGRVVGPSDLDALVEYIQQLPQPFGARVEGRIGLR